MSATITIPAELEQRIGIFAAAQGKNLQQVTIEALEMVFDPNDTKCGHHFLRFGHRGTRQRKVSNN